MSPGRGRSIGEVLEELHEEFPDISVSKIRFLEAQGLLRPERTPSGYRQFSDEDVALLRWVLFQQREHYLPLKVIRRRLKDGDGPMADDCPADEPDPAGLAEAAGGPDGVGGPPDTPTAMWPATALPETAWPEAGMWPEAGDVAAEEVGAASGLSDEALAELASFGLLTPGAEGDFGPGSVAAARAAAGFADYGVEARHLRMYKTFAEREAAFFAQVGRTAEGLAELARLGGELRLALLLAALGHPSEG